MAIVYNHQATLLTEKFFYNNAKMISYKDLNLTYIYSTENHTRFPEE